MKNDKLKNWEVTKTEKQRIVIYNMDNTLKKEIFTKIFLRQKAETSNKKAMQTKQWKITNILREEKNSKEQVLKIMKINKVKNNNNNLKLYKKVFSKFKFGNLQTLQFLLYWH